MFHYAFSNLWEFSTYKICWNAIILVVLFMTVFHWLSQIILVHDTPPHAFYIIPDILTVNRITTAHIFALHSKYRFVYIWNELCANGDIQSSFLTIWEHYRNRWIIALMNCVYTIPGYSLEVLVCILTKPFSYLHLLIVFLSAYIAYIAYEFPKEYHVTKVSENWCTTWHKWYAKYVCDCEWMSGCSCHRIYARSL